MTDLVRLTERAAAKVQEFTAQDGERGAKVRLEVVRTHCMGGRGHAYDFAFTDSQRSDDAVVESHGVTLLLDPGSAARLRGTEIDYLEGLEASGFAITNPNAVGKCPCGHHDLFP
jgi:iron-sulfur cluster assembly accessory protein